MTISKSDISSRRLAFRQLHQTGCFLVPNPWDIGSAKLLQGMGFKALATTSSGHAWSSGLPDGAESRSAVIAYVRDVVEATTLPVNADFGNGFGISPEQVEESVSIVLETGVAALSIEDSTEISSSPLFSLDVAVARMRAARRAIDQAGGEALLVGRAENFLFDQPDLEDTIRRLRAYSEAGADCLYAPGVKLPDHIEKIVKAVAPKPFNLLVGSPRELTVAQIAGLGVRRISLGGALARVAFGSFSRAAQDLLEFGRFDQLVHGIPGTELNSFFSFASDPEPIERRARISGTVVFREGEGTNLPIPQGFADLTITPRDVTVRWLEDGVSVAAALPCANLSYYLARGDITLVD